MGTCNSVQNCTFHDGTRTFYSYSWCRKAAKLFRSLLSPYSLIGTCNSVQNCTFSWLYRNILYLTVSVEAAKLFRSLLSQYRLMETCSTVQNCTFVSVQLHIIARCSCRVDKNGATSRAICAGLGKHLFLLRKPTTHTRDFSPLLLGSLPTTSLPLLPCHFLEQQERPFSVSYWFFFSSLLLVRSALCESQWVLTVHSVLRANQWEPIYCFLFTSCFLYNPKFWQADYSAFHLLSGWFLVRPILLL
jgi:hypothetical protein